MRNIPRGQTEKLISRGEVRSYLAENDKIQIQVMGQILLGSPPPVDDKTNKFSWLYIQSYFYFVKIPSHVWCILLQCFFAAAVIELSSQTTKVYNFTTQIRNLLALTHGRQFFLVYHLVLDHR